MNARVISRWTALLAYFALLLMVLGWYAWLAPAGKLPTALILVILALPLLAPLRGLLHARVYTHQWTIFIALFYFVLGVAHAAVPQERTFGVLVVIASLSLFASCITFVRSSRP